MFFVDVGLCENERNALNVLKSIQTFIFLKFVYFPLKLVHDAHHIFLNNQNISKLLKFHDLLGRLIFHIP